jgi:flagellar assembly protein FliH
MARAQRIPRTEGDAALPRPFAAPRASGPDPVEQAFALGRAEGLEEGERRAAALLEPELAAMRTELTQALRRIAELEVSIAARLQATMLELALAAAARIARVRIAADDPVAARALREALEALPAVDGIVARIHPADLAAIQADLALEIDRQNLRLVSDDSIERGGCVVESASGIIDATLGVALDAVRAAAEGRTDTP